MPILVSGVVGAAVALLFAPKPGTEVMTDIKDLASSAMEKGKGWYEQGAAAVKEAMEKGKEAAAESKEKIKSGGIVATAPANKKELTDLSALFFSLPFRPGRFFSLSRQFLNRPLRK